MSNRSVQLSSSPLLASKTPVWRSKFIVAGIASLVLAVFSLTLPRTEPKKADASSMVGTSLTICCARASSKKPRHPLAKRAENWREASLNQGEL